MSFELALQLCEGREVRIVYVMECDLITDQSLDLSSLN